MSITRNFNLVLNAGTSVCPVINVNQYDQGELWVFTLYTETGTKYSPSTGSIVGIKADGYAIAEAGEINDVGQVEITETQQMTACAGEAVFELRIDGGTHGTANFIVMVEESPVEGAVLSDSDLSLIQETLNAIDSFVEIYATPEQFGAVGDGITDDTNAFNSAILNGKNIALDSEKIYSIGNISDIENIEIIGNGATLKTSDVITLGDNGVLNGCVIQATGSTRGYIVYLTGVNAKVCNCHFKTITWTAENEYIRGYNTSLASIYNNNFEENRYGHAIYLNKCFNCSVKDNHMSNCRFPVTIWGGNADPSNTDRSFNGCGQIVIEGNKSINDLTIQTPNQNNAIWASCSNNIVVSNNILVGCGDVGVDFEYCANCVATGNTVKNCLKGALAVFCDSENCTFVGNNVYFDEKPTWWNAYSNTMYPSDTYSLGILIRDASKNITFEGNNFKCDLGVMALTVYKDYAITAQSFNIIGNSFINGTIVINEVPCDAVIKDNVFTNDFNGAEVRINDAYIVKVINNILDNKTTKTTYSKAAIYVTNSTSNTREVEVYAIGNTVRNGSSYHITFNPNNTSYGAYYAYDNVCKYIGIPWSRNIQFYSRKMPNTKVTSVDNASLTVTGNPVSTLYPDGSIIEAYNPITQGFMFMKYSSGSWTHYGAVASVS